MSGGYGFSLSDGPGQQNPTSMPRPASVNSRGSQLVETGFSLNYRDELRAGHSSGLRDTEFAHEGDEPSRFVELNSEVSGDDHPDAPVWHGEGNTAVSCDLLPNLAVERGAPNRMRK